ncbi:MAG: gliding motility-associated-like protein [Flavobacteriales bacterium]|jgi:gliding motility-associated-like protein
MRTILLIAFLNLTLFTYGQVPTNCFEIESILADACGNPEGENEMVRIKIGPSDLLVSDMIVDWPNNTFLGFCQNAGTANSISQLNSTIVGCGWLVEPNSNVLPAGSNVLIVTSENILLSANSFANLNDTLIVIFQCAGNTAGHFSNSASTPRTLIIDFVAPASCGDTVSYLGTSLTGGNGARIDYDWTNNPTYVNDGCQAPFSAATIDLSNVLVNNQSSTTICPDDDVSINLTVFGNFTEIVWTTGGDGNFAFGDTIANIYSSTSNDTLPFYLYAGLIGPCADTLQDSVLISIQSPANVSINPPAYDLCPGETINLTATGGVSYLWSTTETTPVIPINSANTYTVDIFDGCFTTTLSTTITDNGTTPDAQITGNLVLCDGSGTILTGSGTGTLIWSDNTTGATLSTSTAGNFYLIASNACGSDTAYAIVVDEQVTADFSFDNNGTFTPMTVNYTNNSTNADSHQWYLSPGTDNSFAPSTTYNTPGDFTVSLVATNSFGCSDSISYDLFTIPFLELLIPNIATFNGDGINDFFFVESDDVKSITGSIFNRWGQELYSSTGIDFIWDGKDKDGEIVPEGTYFYIMEVTYVNDQIEEKSGPLQVITNL